MGAFGIIAKILPLALNIIPLVERLIGGEKGDEKRSLAVMLIIPVVRAIEAASDREIVDEEKLADGIGQLVDGAVAIMNLFGVLKGKETLSIDG